MKEASTIHLLKYAQHVASDNLPFGTAVSLASAMPTYRDDMALKAPSPIPLLARGLAPSSVDTSTKHQIYLYKIHNPPPNCSGEYTVINTMMKQLIL